MKPTNLEENGCNPISSNCVLWQGPDIACLSLCKGDNVSDVVFKLATELCTLLDTFEISEYDLACLNLEVCVPEDFKALIQLLIERICALEGIEPGQTPGAGGVGCPDCEVNICEDFYFNDPLTGDPITVMQLDAYVQIIGVRVCTIINQIVTINATLADHEGRIAANEGDIASLQSAPAILPQVTPNCLLVPGVPTDIDELLDALEEAFCNLRVYTGTTTDILTALGSICIAASDPQVTTSSLPMSNIPGWINAPVSLADSQNNLWLAMCDIRSAVQFIQANCCDTSCSSIELNVLATIINVNDLRVDFSGSMPGIFTDQVIGSTLTITDILGNVQTIPNILVKADYFDMALPFTQTLNPSIDTSQAITVVLSLRLEDLSSALICDSVIQTIALGTDSCPTIITAPEFFDINWAFTWSGVTPISMTINLYSQLGTVPLISNPLNIVGSNVSGSFSGPLVTEGTNYRIQLRIGAVDCAFVPVTTLSYPCATPTIQAGSTTINYGSPEGDQTGSTVADWVTIYETYYGPISPL